VGRLTWTTAFVKLLETVGVLPKGSEASVLKVAEVRADPEYWGPECQGPVQQRNLELESNFGVFRGSLV
jgi:hypothetical protein